MRSILQLLGLDIVGQQHPLQVALELLQFVGNSHRLQAGDLGARPESEAIESQAEWFYVNMRTFDQEFRHFLFRKTANKHQSNVPIAAINGLTLDWGFTPIPRTVELSSLSSV